MCILLCTHWLTMCKSRSTADMLSTKFASVYTNSTGPEPQGSLRESFFNDARELLGMEAGRPAVPTAQALALMFLYCSSDARDRPDIIFRLAAAEIYKRLSYGRCSRLHHTVQILRDHAITPDFASCMGIILPREVRLSTMSCAV